MAQYGVRVGLAFAYDPCQLLIHGEHLVDGGSVAVPRVSAILASRSVIELGLAHLILESQILQSLTRRGVFLSAVRADLAQKALCSNTDQVCANQPRLDAHVYQASGH